MTTSKVKLLLVLFGAIAILCAGAKSTLAQTKLVFAHYMVTNQDYGTSVNGDKVQGYEKEIQQAQAEGIDGWALNCGGWSAQTYYQTYTSQIFQAANNLSTGFKLFFSADMCCGLSASDIVNMMQTYANNGAYFHYNGRPVLSTFAGQVQGQSFWANSVLAPIRNSGINVFFVPCFFPPTSDTETPTQSEVQTQWNSWWGSVANGLFYWGVAGVPISGYSPNQIPSSDAYANVAHGAGAVYMAPVVPQFWAMTDTGGGRRYYEYKGGQGMRNEWMDIINNSHPEWVELPTWNDFNESTYVSPIDDPNKYPNSNYLYTGATGFYHTHSGFTNLLKYYIQWYKTGSAPAINQDSIYWFYRTQSMNASCNDSPVTQRYGPVADSIYVTCNLTAPATLIVDGQSYSVGGGSSDISVPLPIGSTPTFQLTRNGSVSIPTVSGADYVNPSPSVYDFIYSTGSAVGASGGGTVSNGIHTLTPQCAPSERLDDSAGGTTNGNKIQIWQANGQRPQQWNFSNVGGNTYNLAVNLGPYCLDGGAAQQGSPTQLWSCNGSADQGWKPIASGPGYQLQSAQSGLCLDDTGWGAANGTVVESWPCTANDAAQVWMLDYTTPTIANGVHTLTPGCATGSRLDDSAAGTGNGNPVQIWQATGGSAQQWNFADIGGTTFNLAVNIGPYCLDDMGGGQGTQVAVWSCNGGVNQNWTATALMGGFMFQDGSGLCLDVSGAGSANGTKVQNWPCNYSSAQNWAVN